MTPDAGPTTLGERLKEARTRAGMSQHDLSEVSGIPKPTLSRYENDHVSPSIQSLSRLATALGVPKAMLLPDGPTAEGAFLLTLTKLGFRFSSVAEAERVAHQVAGELRHASG